METVFDSMDLAFSATDTGAGFGKMIAKALPTDRKCSVELKNESSNYTLCNFSVHTESGRCFVPFPPTIRPSAAGEALFSKKPNTARGSVGVFTFDLVNNSTQTTSQKMAVMYKVPFDLNLKSNEYALGVFDVSRQCDRGLFQEMSKTTNESFIRGKAKGPALTHRGQDVVVRATMSDCYTPHMRIQVSDS